MPDQEDGVPAADVTEEEIESARSMLRAFVRGLSPAAATYLVTWLAAEAGIDLVPRPRPRVESREIS